MNYLMGSIIRDKTMFFYLGSGAPCPSPCWYVHWAIRARFIVVSTKGFEKGELLSSFDNTSLFSCFQVSSIKFIIY